MADPRCPVCRGTGIARGPYADGATVCYEGCACTAIAGGAVTPGPRDATIAALAAERDRLRAAVAGARALVLALPRCDHCAHPATHAYVRGAARYCHVHAPGDCPAYPRAAPLLELVRALSGLGMLDAAGGGAGGG